MILLLIICSGLSACSGNEEGKSQSQVVEEVPKTSGESIDLDLTTMSSTMVYAEVYNMMSVPENYIGKTVRMKGLYSAYHDDVTGNDYFACIVQDATACCAQGIEFELADEYKYPDDYPNEGAEVTVVGVFDTYTEGEGKYCTLRNAHLVGDPS